MSDEYFFCPSCYQLLKNDDRNADLISYSYLLDDDDRIALLSYRYLLDDDDDDDDQHARQLSYCFLLDDDGQLVFHMHALRQQDSIERNPPLMDPISIIPLTSSTDDQSTTVDYSRFTRFLEVDDSFLSPWNWNPTALNSESSESRGCSNGSSDSDQPESGDHHGNDPVKLMQFQPESFFAQEVYDGMKLNEEQPKHHKETCKIYDGINLEERLLEEWLLPQHPQKANEGRVDE